MNRKQWIYTSIVVAFMLVIVVFLLLQNRPSDATEPTPKTQVANLTYCADDQFKPCVVSFSTDANDNMFVNLLLPDSSFPGFYLKVTRSEGESTYDCQRFTEAVNNAQCIGEKLPPGEVLHLALIAIKDDTILAQGELSIIGLAYPTLEIAIPTPTQTPTSTPEEAAAVPTENIFAATPTDTPLSLFVLPTFTETPQSYPNPSYPNPSYP